MVFFALTANTNINSLKAAAASGLQYPNTSYYNAPTDCAYANQTADVAAAASNNDAGYALPRAAGGMRAACTELLMPVRPRCGTVTAF